MLREADRVRAEVQCKRIHSIRERLTVETKKRELDRELQPEEREMRGKSEKRHDW